MTNLEPCSPKVMPVQHYMYIVGVTRTILSHILTTPLRQFFTMYIISYLQYCMYSMAWIWVNVHTMNRERERFIHLCVCFLLLLRRPWWTRSSHVWSMERRLPGIQKRNRYFHSKCSAQESEKSATSNNRGVPVNYFYLLLSRTPTFQRSKSRCVCLHSTFYTSTER